MKAGTRAGAILTAAAIAVLCGTSPALAGGALAGDPGSPSGKLALIDCQIPDFEPGKMIAARCGRLMVPEDPSRPNGRKIPLAIAVLPATGPNRAPDPVFYFVGGPGQKTIELAPTMKDLPVYRNRDLVLVDRRGTGGSNSLGCDPYGGETDPQGYLGALLPAAGIKACLAEVSKRADLRFYGTNLAADDVDAVRAALGYDKINVAGGSYGSRLAIVYARQHPSHTRTVTLTSVFTPDAALPLHFAQDAQAALDGVFAECEAAPGCRSAFPRLREEFAETLARVKIQPARAHVTHPVTGKQVEVRFNSGAFGEAIRYMLYTPATSTELPALIHAAHGGDWDVLAQRTLDFRRGLAGSVEMGTHVSVLCSEDVPFMGGPQALEKATRGTFLGHFRIEQYQGACANWPRAQLPAGFRELVKSDVPTLIFTGQLDPSSPPYTGEKTHKQLPNSLHLIIPSAGHSTYGLEGAECVNELIATFVERGSVKGLDTSCMANIRRPPFPVTLPKDA